MRVVFRHAWMQKHPTPSNGRGDFHWHPASIPAAIRGTLTELVTRERSQTAGLWIIDGSYLAWARSFGALSPVDRRRYTGLAVTVAQPAAGERAGAGDWSGEWSGALPEVLARLPLAPAAPLIGDAAASPGAHQVRSSPAGSAPLALSPADLAGLFRPGDPDLARALYSGGSVQCRDPHCEGLPGVLGRLLSWLPAAERVRPRTGVLTDRAVSPQQNSARANRAGDGAAGSGIDNLLHYLAAAWFCPPAISERSPDYARMCWRLVGDLARGASGSLAELFAELTAMARAWNSADALYRYLLDSGALSPSDVASCDARAPSPLYARSVSDAGWLWNRLLHYWGRGFLPERALSRLAALLARRVAADHLFYLDAPDAVALPGRYLRRLRYEALLPRARVTAMHQAVARQLPSLSHDPEVHLV